MEQNVKPQSATTMAMVMLPQSVWEDITADLKEVKDFIRRKDAAETSEWMDGDQARKMLGVCPKTWQTYRDRRIIPFAQFGRKIMVRKSDVEAFLNSHFISSEVRG